VSHKYSYTFGLDLPVFGSHPNCSQNSSRGLVGSSLGGGGFCLAK
jgi:hypothetical protein